MITTTTKPKATQVSALFWYAVELSITHIAIHLAYRFLDNVATSKQPKAAKQSTITQKGLRTHAHVSFGFPLLISLTVHGRVCTAAKASARKKVQKAQKASAQKVQGSSATQELPPIAKSIVIGSKVTRSHAQLATCSIAPTSADASCARIEERPYHQVQQRIPEESIRLVV